MRAAIVLRPVRRLGKRQLFGNGVEHLKSAVSHDDYLP
jgi:hypothetical protein